MLTGDAKIMQTKNDDNALGKEDDDVEEFKLATKAKSGFQTRGVLCELDKNGDGFITREEVEQFIGEHRLLESEKKFFKYGFIVMVGLMIVFSFVIAGFTWGVVILTKEVSVENDVMVSSETGDPIQCASSDLMVENGVLIARSDSMSIGRRMSENAEDDFLNDVTTTALGVRNVYKKRLLSSTMPDKYFKELVWFEIESPTGAFLSLRVMTIIRLPSAKALCGTYLKLGTMSGTIILDDFDLFYDDAINDAFLQAGLIDHNVASRTSRRQLSSIDHGNMRRLSGGDFSLIGFFNAIEDDEWTCQSVRKPEMPTEYSANFTLLSLCDVGSDLPNQCNVDICESIDPLPGYGLVTVDGVEYHTRTREAYVTTEFSALVDTYPYLPGMKFITQSFSDGTTRMYQFDVEGTLCQCQEFENMPIRMTLPDDYLLYPLGDVGDNLYRYRVSYKGIKQHISHGEEWIHIDYFEDNTTFMPKALISDDNILQVEWMRTGLERDHFSSSGYTISEEDFARCTIATKVVESDRYEIYVNGGTFITKNSTLSEIKKYRNEESSWNWTSTPYPPSYAPLSSFADPHLRYLAQYHTIYNATDEKYTGLGGFGEWLAKMLNLQPEEVLIESANVTDTNPHGTFHVPYNHDTSFNFTEFFGNMTFTNSANETYMTRALSLQQEVSPTLRSDRSSGRRLGVKFDVDPFVPYVGISIEKYTILYEAGYLSGDLHHIIALEGKGCFMGVACVYGNIHATIRDGSPDMNDYGGSVSVFLDIKAIKFEVVTIRYDYYGGTKSYGNYYLSLGAHIAAVERTLTLGKQVRGTAGIELAMAKKKVKRSDSNFVRYNAGMVKFYLKGQYFEGIGHFGMGSWKTAFTYTYPVTSWGSKDSAALANCDGSIFVDLPVNELLPPHWSAGVGDVYANMDGGGSFKIKLKIAGTREVLWSSGTNGAEQNIAWMLVLTNYVGFHILSHYDYTVQYSFSLTFDSSYCKHGISPHGYCRDTTGEVIRAVFLPDWDDVVGPGRVRWRLYGDGNMKIEYSQVEMISGWSITYYKFSWKTAWESGTHGSCAKKA